MDIIKNDYIRITKNTDGVYLETYKKGYLIQDFNVIITNNPEIRITSFIAIRNALLNAPHPPVKFGIIDQRIVIEVTDNDMKAYVTLYLEEHELSHENRASLMKEIIVKLRERGVIYGIKADALAGRLESRVPVLVAEGIPPVNGKDSVIKMFELKEPKPEIKEDGKVDHYELNLINKVQKGDWLGERTDPTDGAPGKSVKGEVVHQLKGKRFPLFYDPSTVSEVYENGVTTLYAKTTGAVHYNGDKISVSNYLEISSDIDFNTGNIDFDGFLTVKGAIADNFSVAARDDLEVLGEFGIGSVKEVVSRGGNILIKGGIAGKNKAVIRSTKDIYTKFISDATVISDGVVYVGFYCLNSNIIAKQVIVESAKGRIIGGVIEAEQKVEAAYIGNEREIRTQIIVKGFSRSKMKKDLDELHASLVKAKENLAKAKQAFSIFTEAVDSSSKQYKSFDSARERYFQSKDEVRRLEKELRTMQKYFRVKGEGEVNILKRAYPNTMIQIKNETKELFRDSIASCFFMQDNEMREI
ncbi:MAG: DUF342 domain-containing protein [Clostridiaceae bacterium]|jgi:uncharacterized protein (DUF342 family)|nr:DUF342 domain-containing protein [Clostridiaceae bacterium]